MNRKKIAFCTLGCKVNQYETNAMIQEFIKKKYEVVEFDEKADIYVINTCTVTNMADRKSRQMLRKVKELAPRAVLIAVGCYAQVGREELEKIPEIDLILGNNEKKDVVKFAENAIKKKTGKLNVHNSETMAEGQQNKEVEDIMQVTDVLHCEEYLEFGAVTFTEKTRAVIKVQDGCDRFCSYCIIPYARGHIRSRRPEQVVSEISKIAQMGIKEVVITGIHLASYGRDFAKNKSIDKNVQQGVKDDKKIQELEISIGQEKKIEKGQNEYRLIDLLEEINEIEGIERIRLRFVRANTYNRRVCGKII